MNRALCASVSLILALPLAGCNKRVTAVAPPPPPTPTAVVSVPPPTHPTEPLPEIPVITSEEVPIPTEPVVRPPVRRRIPTTNQPVETASAAPSGIADLGELTTGGESNNEQFRHQTEDLLRTQNRRLTSMSTAIIAMHSQQVEQARLYLRQAADAWKKQDMEGARTLGTKAKVILDEILG
ncbi:hypothetical protein [Terriglobus sp. TAA 43]|uniref:hypothetical protein n=1 Tax=Terriglobus sp. TAA 43 TaxID=278961 RepID=UPI000649285C|nr:hypothetical protein [Terriglobus sp. TAA 43]